MFRRILGIALKEGFKHSSIVSRFRFFIPHSNRALRITSMAGVSFLATMNAKTDDSKDRFFKSYQTIPHSYKKVLNDLGFSEEQSAAVMSFHDLLYCVWKNISFNFELNPATERAQALESLKTFFSSSNFTVEHELDYIGENGSNSADITYQNFPSSIPFEERHQQLLKIAKTLDIEVNQDIKYYDYTVLNIAKTIEQTIDRNYLNLRCNYNKPRAVNRDAEEAKQQTAFRFN